MKILLIDSSLPINSRNSKIVKSFRDRGSIVKIVSWSRAENDVSKGVDFVYYKKSPLGDRFRKLINLRGYYKYIKEVVGIEEYNIIIASHWDMLLLASLLKNKEHVLIYDNLDIPTSKSLIILKLIRYLEFLALKKANLIIYASRFFKDLYRNIRIPSFDLENIPNLGKNTINKDQSQFKAHTDIVVGFIGTIRYKEILFNLIDVVKDLSCIKLYFFGGGPDEQEVKLYASEASNISFFGRFSYSDIPSIYNKIDYVWAAYPDKDLNVQYAISNKFYESVVYRKPGIYSQRTHLGMLVQKEGIGYVVNPYDKDNIKALLKSLQRNNVCEISKLDLYSNKINQWDQLFDELDRKVRQLNFKL